MINLYLHINIKPVKKKHKMEFDCHMLEKIIPGAGKLDVLPRKQKKALKKKISVDLLKYIDEHTEELIRLIESKKIND
jgi:hypothetical protein